MLIRIGAYALTLTALATRAQARPLAGLWDGKVRYDELTIEFPIELAGSGKNVTGSFFNGDERVTSTQGSQTGDTLVLEFADYATQLNAHEQDGVLRGTYGNKLIGIHDIELRRHRAASGR
jgi:hypothetical protein